MANKRTPKPASPRKAGKAAPSPKDSQLPGLQHPGQVGAKNRQHDQPGSQPERARHGRGSTIPKAGAARTDKKAVARSRSKKQG